MKDKKGFWDGAKFQNINKEIFVVRKKIAGVIVALSLSLALTLAGCGGGTKTAAGSTAYSPTQSAPVRPAAPQTYQPAPTSAQSAQTSAPATTADALDMAVAEAGNYLGGRIPKGDKVAFVSAGQNLLAVAGYVIDGLIEKAVNDGAFAVVDRAQLDAIRLEQEFQLSGDVNDSTVQSIGRILGVRTIVTVVVTQMGEAYRLGVRALSIESAQIQGQFNRNIPAGPTINALAGAPAPAKPTLSRPATTTPAPQQITAQSSQPQPSASAVTTTTQSAAIPTAPTVPAGAVTPPGNTLAEQLAYIESKAGRGTVYDIVINTNLEVKPMTISTMGKDITVIIRSADPKNVRTIQLDIDQKGHLFSVATNVTLKLQDIVLKGHNSNDKALVMVGGGAMLTLNSGTKIVENINRSNDNGGGVYVNGGVLELNKGGEIAGNTSGRGGGISVNRGVINIRGGSITSNTAGMGGGIYAMNSTVTISDGAISKNQFTGGFGGGIFATHNSTIIMTGGIISGNRGVYSIGITNTRGGGVYVESSRFIKKAEEGSETSGVIYGATGQNANIARSGSAVAAFTGGKMRNTTLSAYDEISTESSRGWEE